ncbi:MAG: hypothetical protein JXA74_12870, partial [Anaerolineae bacterium]|nr:hypothetical protein [Anaerolineae bacterium]
MSSATDTRRLAARSSDERRMSLGEALARQVRRWRHQMQIGPQTLRNERLIYAEMPFQAIAGAGAMSFLGVFLVRLGAPNWLVGLYTSLPALFTILAVLPMGAFVARRGQFVQTAVVGRLFFRAIIGLFAFLPFLPPS